MTFYTFARVIMNPIYSVIYPTKIVGRENYTHSKAIYVCNHYTTTDSIIIACKLMKKGCNALAKKELFEKNKFQTYFCRKLGGIPIDREKLDINSYKEVMAVLNANKPLLVFPEGTRNRTGSREMLPIKNGVAMYAIKAHAPIIPMQFFRPHRPFRKNYLVVGKPIDFSQYYDKKFTNEVKDETNLLIKNAFISVREQVDRLALGKK